MEDYHLKIQAKFLKNDTYLYFIYTLFKRLYDHTEIKICFNLAYNYDHTRAENS